MGRIITWLVVIFIVLLALRVAAMRSARARRRTAAPAPEPMVRCARCGVFLPRAEARDSAAGFVCGGRGCLPHG